VAKLNTLGADDPDVPLSAFMQKHLINK